MSPFSRLKITAVLFSLTFWGLSLSGCVSFEKRFPEIKTYSLQTNFRSPSYAGQIISVHLNPLSDAPRFADRYLTYRVTDLGYESDFYNQLMTSPAVMIESQTQSWLKQSAVIEFVLPAKGVINDYFSIDGRVLEFYGDYRNIANPRAVLKMEWTVSQLEAAGTAVIFQKVYAEELSIAQTSPRLLVEGWGQALVHILTSFEADLRTLTEKTNKK